MTTAKSHLQAIYDFISLYWQEHDYAPTMKETAAHIGLSRSSTLRHLELLRVRGVIEWQEHQQRSIRVIGPAHTL